MADFERMTRREAVRVVVAALTGLAAAVAAGIGAVNAAQDGGWAWTIAVLCGVTSILAMLMGLLRLGLLVWVLKDPGARLEPRRRRGAS